MECEFDTDYNKFTFDAYSAAGGEKIVSLTAHPKVTMRDTMEDLYERIKAAASKVYKKNKKNPELKILMQTAEGEDRLMGYHELTSNAAIKDFFQNHPCRPCASTGNDNKDILTTLKNIL